MTRRALAFIVLAVALGSACAPKVAPPKAAGVLRYPDFVYPAPPERVGDARARARLQEGWSRLQAGDLKGAESAFGQLVQQQPAFYPAAVGLGYALLAQSKPKEALARFDAASRTAPRYGPALAGRGEALLASGQRDAALEAFEAALAADAALGDLHRRIDALKLDRFQDRVAAATRASGRRPLRRGARGLRGGDCALAGHRVPLSRPRPGRGAPEEPARSRTEPPEGDRAGPGRQQGAHEPGRRARRAGQHRRGHRRPRTRLRARAVRRPETAPRPASRAGPNERSAAGVRRHPAPAAGHAR